MLFDRGVVAQESDRRVLVGGQLREHDHVPQARLNGQVGKTPLLLLRPLGGRRDQVGPFGALQRRGDRGRIASIGIDPDQVFEIQLATLTA